MRIWIAPMVGIGLIAACSDHDDFAPWDLSCTDTVLVHGDPKESFTGHATPAEAVESWMLGTPHGPPAGKWVHLEGDRWIVVDRDGKTVGRAEVEVFTGFEGTTMAAERYASFNIEYCE